MTTNTFVRLGDYYINKAEVAAFCIVEFERPATCNISIVLKNGEKIREGDVSPDEAREFRKAFLEVTV